MLSNACLKIWVFSAIIAFVLAIFLCVVNIFLGGIEFLYNIAFGCIVWDFLSFFIMFPLFCVARAVDLLMGTSHLWEDL